MVNRRSVQSTLQCLFALGAFLWVGTSLSSARGRYQTRNFIIYAPTQQIAEQMGQYAERYRREKALEWLGYEMKPWGRRCPLEVTVNMGGSGGATSFVFDRGQIQDQKMEIQGRLDRLLASVLPHEVTHTVFAYYFRRPVPRWADEGGSVLSEDQLERSRHDHLVRNILRTRGRAMPLRRLFNLRNYPSDVMVLYAQGYSVTNFLVSKSSKPRFLRFLDEGMRRGWDSALNTHYGFRSVEALEEAWLDHLRRTPPESPTDRDPPMVVQGQPRPTGNPSRASLSNQVVVRQTTPPVPLSLNPSGRQPIVRGQSYEEDYPPRYNQPRYNQPYRPTSRTRPASGFASPGGRYDSRGNYGQPQVHLGPPQGYPE